MASLRELILAADDLPREKVTVPEWGVDVWIRTMTAAEKETFDLEGLKAPGESAEVNYDNYQPRLLVRVLLDENGERLFGNGKDDIAAIGTKSGRVIERLFEIAARVNGLDKTDVEKNSETPDASSSSD